MIEALIAEPAEEEYAASLRWYAERSQKAAQRFEAEFAKALEAIGTAPDRYPRCDDGRHRFYLLKRYPFRIIYRKIDDRRQLVVALAHTGRKPNDWSRR
jgi:toxin ParE1/3/4